MKITKILIILFFSIQGLLATEITLENILDLPLMVLWQSSNHHEIPYYNNVPANSKNKYQVPPNAAFFQLVEQVGAPLSSVKTNYLCNNQRYTGPVYLGVNFQNTQSLIPGKDSYRISKGACLIRNDRGTSSIFQELIVQPID